MTQNTASTYAALYQEVLKPTAFALEEYLKEVLDKTARIDRISARAKAPESFATKALKTNSDGTLKYFNPLVQIQDQIGARISVLFLSDFPKIKSAIDDYFHAVEWTEKKPDKDTEFSYFGEHYILKIPDDAIPEGLEGQAPEFFELQIKTLFQHAWSETSHDIGYKAPRELNSLEVRKMALSAAQAWGADQIFKELEADISASNDDDPPDADCGKT